MKIAVIGAQGMLGRDLCRVLGDAHEILAWDIDQINITDRAATLQRLEAEHPHLIVNAAAFVNVERCETEPETAWSVNAVGAQNLALSARRLDSDLLYFCSDYIFDGESETDYDEVAEPRPVNQYGRSKLAGERMSLQICPRTYSVRTAWLFGHAPNNYVQRVLDQAQEHGVVRMPADQVESPTYTIHLAELLAQLITTGAYGVYHATSIGACTRPAFARFVLDQAGRKEKVETVEAAKIQRLAGRPARAVLDCRLVQLVTGMTLPTWQQGVQAYMEEAARRT